MDTLTSFNSLSYAPVAVQMPLLVSPALGGFGLAQARLAGGSPLPGLDSGATTVSNANNGNAVLLQVAQLLMSLMAAQASGSLTSGSSAGAVAPLSGSGSSNTVSSAGSGALGQPPAADDADQSEIKDFIGKAAGVYGADPKVLSEIARRESGFKAGAVNDWDSNAKKGTPSKGMFQFIEPTFKSYAAEAKKDKPEAWKDLGEFNWMDWRQQALACAWAITHGKGSAWSTYTAAGGK